MIMERRRPQFGELTALGLNGIRFEITFNTLPNRLFAAHEFLSSYLFVHPNVAARQTIVSFTHVDFTESLAVLVSPSAT